METFAEGDLVEYVNPDAYAVLMGDARFGTLQKEDDPTGGFPWLLVLTPEAQEALRNLPGDEVPRDEADRLAGWLVREDEIRKVED